jgi:hypothetical protein
LQALLIHLIFNTEGSNPGCSGGQISSSTGLTQNTAASEWTSRPGTGRRRTTAMIKDVL